MSEEEHLLVSEIFCSLQGEGRWLGCPAIFVRLAKCNLNCDYCDSEFAREETTSFRKMNPNDIISEIRQNYPWITEQRSTFHLVITGGEPLLQQDRIPDLIKTFNDFGIDFTEIETNGTILPGTNLLLLTNWWNCSPKLSNSGNSHGQRIKPDVISSLVNYGNADFKFVVNNLHDITEMENDFIPTIPKSRIALMPLGSSRDNQIARMKEIAQLCIDRGYRFTPRLHSLLWDDDRGR